MRTVLADSFYYFALLSDRDAAHRKAIEFNKTFAGRIVITEWAITELGDGWSSPSRRSAFVTTLETLEADPDIDIVRFDHDLWQAGIALYANRLDKEWSLTDCISFAVMQRKGLTEALTGDRHFEQAGFVALLK